jgi:hypothetical protein
MVDKSRPSKAEPEEWYFRSNDPKQYEKEAFVDRINEINF